VAASQDHPEQAGIETAPAPTHIARTIVNRLSAEAVPLGGRFSFERRAGARRTAGGDVLQVGTIRLPAVSHAVAPVVIRRQTGFARGSPPDGAEANRQPAPVVGGNLLERARALFSTSSTQSPAPTGLTDFMVEADGDAPPGPDPHNPQPGDPPVIRRLWTGESGTGPTGGLPVTTPSRPVDQSSAVVDAETIEWIIEAVEERVLEELERRGLRYNPGVF
jgi:hypothetical protein